MRKSDVNGTNTIVLGPFIARLVLLLFFHFRIVSICGIVWMLSLYPLQASSATATAFAWSIPTIRRAASLSNNNFVGRNVRLSKNHRISHSLGHKVKDDNDDRNIIEWNNNMYYLDSTKSTQEEAKRILGEKKTNDNTNNSSSSCSCCWGVTARQQTNGKGTSGREWKGVEGNCFLTIALPCSSVPFPLTLLPLFVGNAVAHTISSSFVTHKIPVSVKWPNDILICDKKVAGVLIECDMEHFLIGIGINVAHAPTISSQGSHRGRASTCLHEYIYPINDNSDHMTEDGAALSKQLATNITSYISNSISITTQEEIISTWSHYAEKGKFFDKPSLLRDELRFQSYVRPLSIQPDGQLRVRDEQTGKERLLCADYLL